MTEELMVGFPEYGHSSDFELNQVLRKLKSMTVRHRQTCTCGRTLVNTYYRDPGTMATPQQRKDAWKCKKCWDKYDSIDHKLQELIEEDINNATQPGRDGAEFVGSKEGVE